MPLYPFQLLGRLEKVQTIGRGSENNRRSEMVHEVDVALGFATTDGKNGCAQPV